MFSTALHHFLFPPATCESSDFSVSPAALNLSFDYSHSSGCDVISPCGFVLVFEISFNESNYVHYTRK